MDEWNSKHESETREMDEWNNKHDSKTRGIKGILLTVVGFVLTGAILQSMGTWGTLCTYLGDYWFDKYEYGKAYRLFYVGSWLNDGGSEYRLGYMLENEIYVKGRTEEAEDYYRQWKNHTSKDERKPKMKPTPTPTPFPADYFNIGFNYYDGINGYPQEEAKKHPWTGNPEKVGEIVTFGRYPQEEENSTATGIEWKVLDVKDGKSLLISQYALDVKKYNEESADVTWETCTLRRWLNQEFLQKAFTQEEQGAIVTSIVQNSDNENSYTEGGNDTKDKVFILSIGEAEQLFSSDKERLCIPTKYALALKNNITGKEDGAVCFWWLRSPGRNSFYAAMIWPDGSVDKYGFSAGLASVAVRPALWLNLSS